MSVLVLATSQPDCSFSKEKAISKAGFADRSLFEDDQGFAAPEPRPLRPPPQPVELFPIKARPEVPVADKPTPTIQPAEIDRGAISAKPIEAATLAIYPVRVASATIPAPEPQPLPVETAQFTDVEPLLAPSQEVLPVPQPAPNSGIRGSAGGLATSRETLIEVKDQPLAEALDLLAEDSPVSFLLSEKAGQIDKVSLRLQNVSPREAFEALVTKYSLDHYTSAGGRLIHVRLADEVSEDVSDPGYRERLRRLYEQLEAEINQTFVNSSVRLSLVGDQVVVRGEANDVVEAEQILTLVARNAPGRPEAQGIEAISLQLTETLYTPSGGSTRTATGPAQGILGNDPTQDPPQVVNLLRVVGEQQVMLRVTVAEVDRSAARSIGLSFNAKDSGGADVFSSLFDGLGSVSADAMNPGFLAGTAANLPATLDNGQISLAINALRQLNLARTLAEPNLTALNGRTATFEAGGKFPVPVVAANAGDGLQGVRFERFGVLLEFVPFILDRDRIRLNVAAGVSVRNPDLGASVGGSEDAGGTDVPGLNTRSFETTVELREGQTLAVAGLLQNEYVADSDRVPGWGDLPLIGRTGAFDRVTSREQELVILITPELVHPLGSEESMPLPGADIFEPSDIEFYLHGRLESRRAEDFRAGARTDHARQMSYEHCESRVMIGSGGYSCGCAGACPSCAR